MKRCLFIVCGVVVIIVSVVSISSCEQKPKAIKSEGITVGGLPDKGIVIVGTKEQVEGTKKAMTKLIDPADDYAISARGYYNEGNYEKAEQECLKAIRLGKHKIVHISAHGTLLKVYEATKEYELAIKEINWLLENVSIHAKPGLIEKKKELQVRLVEAKENKSPAN